MQATSDPPPGPADRCNALPDVQRLLASVEARLGENVVKAVVREVDRYEFDRGGNADAGLLEHRSLPLLRGRHVEFENTRVANVIGKPIGPAVIASAEEDNLGKVFIERLAHAVIEKTGASDEVLVASWRLGDHPLASG